MSSAGGLQLIDAIAEAGAVGMVFAGGDPSLRRDLASLCSYASSRGLLVEIQTNAHRITKTTSRALRQADLVGLSIDGHDAKTHDQVRGRRGNYDRVIRLLGALEEFGIPVIVRSLVIPSNYSRLHELGPVLAKYRHIVRWSLLEFTPVNDGHRNASAHHLATAAFDEAAARCAAYYHGPAEVDVYRQGQKEGTYALITPDGRLYGTQTVVDGTYPTVGSMVADHLADLIAALEFEPSKHNQRYGSQLELVKQTRVEGDAMGNDALTRRAHAPERDDDA